jgi:hypothetical protein
MLLEGIQVSQEARDQAALTAEELANEGASDLPDREAMSLLNLNLNLDLGVDGAAPINAAAAANLNVAAPIDAAVSANVGSVDSTSVAIADQDSIIVQELTGSADATADQASNIDQGA